MLATSIFKTASKRIQAVRNFNTLHFISETIPVCQGQVCKAWKQTRAPPHISPHEPWFLAIRNPWRRFPNVAIPHTQEQDLFETADGVPQGDPLSTLVFATAMSLLLQATLWSKAPDVSMLAYVDDTVLLGTVENVTQAMTEIQAETATGSLKLEKAKTQAWSPTAIH